MSSSGRSAKKDNSNINKKLKLDGKGTSKIPHESDFELDDEIDEYPPTQAVDNTNKRKSIITPPPPLIRASTATPPPLPKTGSTSAPSNDLQIVEATLVEMGSSHVPKKTNELLSEMATQITQDYLNQSRSANVQLKGLKLEGVPHMVSGIVVKIWNLHLSDDILGRGKELSPEEIKKWQFLFSCLHGVKTDKPSTDTFLLKPGSCKFERMAFAISLLQQIRSMLLDDILGFVDNKAMPFFCRVFASHLLITKAKQKNESSRFTQGKIVNTALLLMQEVEKFVKVAEIDDVCKKCSRQDRFYKLHRYYSLVTKILHDTNHVLTLNELMENFWDSASDRDVTFQCDLELNRKQMFYVHEEYLRFWGLEKKDIKKFDLCSDADPALLETLFLFVYRDERIKTTSYISHVREITKYCAEIGFPNPSAIIKFDVMNLEQLLKRDRENNITDAKQYCLRNLSEWYRNNNILETLSFDSMKDFLEDDYLALPETEIFDLSIRWSKLTSPNESEETFLRISKHLRIGRLTFNEFGEMMYRQHGKFIMKLDTTNILLYLQRKQHDPSFDASMYEYNARERQQLL